MDVNGFEAAGGQEGDLYSCRASGMKRSAMDAGRMSECIKSPAKLSSLPPLLPALLPPMKFTDERVTEVSYLDGAAEFIHDAWADSSRRRSGREVDWPNRLLPKGRR